MAPSTTSGLGILSAIGLESAYPELKLGTLTAAGEKAVGEALSECVIELLTQLNGANFQEFTTSHESLEELEKSEPAFKKALEEQSLDNKATSAPVYHYHGLEDEVVPLNQDVNLHYDWCKLGVTDDFQLFNGEHLFTAGMGSPSALKWIEERVAGKAAPSTCGQHSPGATLPANARLDPGGRRSDREAQRMVAERQSHREASRASRRSLPAGCHDERDSRRN